MYIRFESSTPCHEARGREGIFAAAYDVWNDRDMLGDTWQLRELRRVLNWFNNHLEAPERFDYRAGRKASLSGLCWFRDTAVAHISQARYMRWLLEDLGMPIDIHRTDRPGRILWSDDHQIVALRDIR